MYRQPKRNATALGDACAGGVAVGAKRAARAKLITATMHGDGHGHGDDRLRTMLHAKLDIAVARASRGAPAYERFPQQAFRYRDWGAQTRHGRGDMSDVHVDTLRNYADHLFDASTGYLSGPSARSASSRAIHLLDAAAGGELPEARAPAHQRRTC